MAFLLLTTNVIIFRHMKSSHWFHCSKYFSRNSMHKELNKIVQGAPSIWFILQGMLVPPDVKGAGES